MKKINLSIIIPHYNRPKLLAKLLDSIPNNPEIEVIVVDDKTDKYIEDYNKTMSSYQNRNINFYSNESKYKGAGAARNIALSYATGDWIIFADADDYFLEGWYKNIKKYYSSNYDSISFFATSIYSGAGLPSDRHLDIEKKQVKYLNNPNSENLSILKYKITSPCCKLIKAKIIQQNLILFEHIHRSEDIMFCTKLAAYLNKITVDKSTIYCITDSKNSLSKGVKDHDLLTDCNTYIRRYKFLQTNLTKHELTTLNLFGFKHVIKALRYRKIKLSFLILKLLIKNRVKIFPYVSIYPPFFSLI